MTRLRIFYRLNIYYARILLIHGQGQIQPEWASGQLWLNELVEIPAATFVV